MFIVQTNLVRVKLVSYVNALFSLKMFVMQIYWDERKYLHEKKKRVFWQTNMAAFSKLWWPHDVTCMKTINSLLEPRSDSTVRC